MKTALETLQPTLTAAGAPQLEGVASIAAPQPDSLRLGKYETAPVSLGALGERAISTAFESLADTLPAEGRGTTQFTTPQKLEGDPQSGS